MFSELTFTLSDVTVAGPAAQAFLFLAVAGTAALVGMLISVVVPFVKRTN